MAVSSISPWLLLFLLQNFSLTYTLRSPISLLVVQFQVRLVISLKNAQRFFPRRIQNTKRRSFHSTWNYFCNNNIQAQQQFSDAEI